MQTLRGLTYMYIELRYTRVLLIIALLNFYFYYLHVRGNMCVHIKRFLLIEVPCTQSSHTE